MAPHSSSHRQLTLVRGLMICLLVVAIVLAIAVAVPTASGSGGKSALPSVALGQVAIYRLEVFLVAFYGGLLILTPAYRGLVLGRLPIEISAKGAKFAEDAADSIEETQKLVGESQAAIRDLESSLARSRLNIDQLANATGISLED